MQTLKFLGRGSAFNAIEGNTSAYIKDNDTLLLIDCGENIFERILKLNILDDVKEVSILITHLHSDHIGSLSSLIYYCYYVKNIKPIIYFPTKELYVLLEIMGHIESDEYYFEFLDDNRDNWCKIGNVYNIHPIKVSHKSTLNSYGYVLYLKSKTIYYSGDSNMIPEKIIKNGTIVYLDEIYQDTCLLEYPNNVHLSLTELCKLIPTEYRNKVYCIHIDNSDNLLKLIKKNGFNVVEVD